MSHASAARAASGVSHPAIALRYGVKGAGAPAWLARQGVTVPEGPNRIAAFRTAGGGGRCLRLGHGEFLVEFDTLAGTATTAGLPRATPQDQAWILLRSDCCVRLEGPHWPAALAQACSYDFTRFAAAPDQVVMTLLAGIGVTLVREAGSPDALRLWCDASYADYLQHVLHTLNLEPGEPR